MGALAQRWEWDEHSDPAGRTAAESPSAGPSRSRRHDPADESRRSWNVLTEQLVSYPPRSQQIWLDARSARAEAASSDERATAYASAWLDDELQRLRERRLSVRASADRFDSERAPRLFEPVRTDRRVGDPSTVASPRPVPVRRERIVAPTTRRARRAHATPQHRAAQARARQLSATRTRTRVAVLERGLRRLLPGAATLAVLAGVWLGAGTLASASHDVTPRTLPGSVIVGGHSVYVVQPGDTLWSIATRVEPNADPRPLVDELQSQLHGEALQPGDRLTLPGPR